MLYRRRFRQDHPFRNKPGGANSIALRDIESFHLLARRYVGDQHEVRKYWTDFMGRLPSDLGGMGKALFIGLFHDDPRITPASQARYDCCATVGTDFQDFDGSLAQRGFYLTRTYPGRYACLDHRGSRSAVEASYRTLTDDWSQRARLSVEHPAIEVHVVPRNMQDPENLSFTILLALE
jgi:DNA gyrase inhibitor GyrI